MQKNCYWLPMRVRGENSDHILKRRSINQIKRVMKLTMFFLMFAIVSARATGFAQNVSISGKNLSLRTVFSIIEEQTGYVVFTREAAFKADRNITLSVTNMPLRQLLNKVLKDKAIEYVIEDKTIFLSEKKRAASADVSVSGNSVAPVLMPVSGIVTDSAGKPLAGATVVVRGKKVSTSTDANGQFRLQADPGDVLVVSYVGFESEAYKVPALTPQDGSKPAIIALRVAPQTISEVVISTGYTQRKVSELTGSVQRFGGDELRSGVSGVNPLAMLKGKATGMYITEQGGSVATRGQIVLRGQASMPDQANSNFGPLIVVDGAITTAANLQDIVNPNDIESLTVLKDAASAAIYGSRAAQGVIVVTTRQGANAPVRVNLNMSHGGVYTNRLVNFMNTAQLTQHITNSMQGLYNNTASIRTRYGTFENYFNTTRPFTDEDRQKNYNWTDGSFYPNGSQSDINLSITGGTERTKIYAGINWVNQDGTELSDNLQRKALRLNIDQRISNKLTFSVNTNVLWDKYTSTNSENQVYLFQPWVSPFEANGALADSVPNYNYSANSARITRYYDNPLYSHDLNTNINQRQNYLLTGRLKYNVLPWLSAQTTNTLQYTNNNTNSYKDPRTYRGRYEGPANNRIRVDGTLSITDVRSTYFLTSNMLTANKTFGDHALSAMVGQEYGETSTMTTSIAAYGTAYPGERNLGAFQNFGTWGNKQNGQPAIPGSPAPLDKSSFSLFGEINESYKGRYLAAVSVRRDASTNFGIENRYGTFFALSGSWLLHKEAFIEKIRPISNLKLRGSYGTSGREAGADFLTFTTFLDNVRYDNLSNFGATIQQLANSQITWETTYTTNIGLDLGLWNRINITADYYRRRSAGLLQTVPLPSYTGFARQIRNVGELTNNGIEVTASAVAVQAGKFKWMLDANITFNRNRLTKIYNDSLIDGFTNAYYRNLGEDINVLKAIRYVGVNADNGRPLFERINADKSVTIVDSIPLAKASNLLSYQVMGSATPKFFGGFSSTLQYGGFTLSMLFNYSYGNRIMNNALRNFMSPTTWQQGFNTAAPTANQRFWQGPGDTNANFPNWYDPAFAQRGGTNINSSLIYQDASYLRLRNIRLAYDFNRDLLSKLKLSALTAYVSADNLFVIKSSELYASDPEGATIGLTSNSYAGTGIYSAMPRRLIFGINVSF